MDINFKILQSKYFNDILYIFYYFLFYLLYKYFNVIKIFALKNFKINIHQSIYSNGMFVKCLPSQALARWET